MISSALIAVTNQKGGVGKTTTSVNLGAALAGLQETVLVIDMDPQANATAGLGFDQEQIEASIYDVLLKGADPEDAIEPTPVRNLYLLPSTRSLADATIELVPLMAREQILRNSLRTLDGQYSYILIDCPPSLGLLTVNALTAARYVLIPMQCEQYALDGLVELHRTIDMVRSALNPSLELLGVLLTMLDNRTRLSREVSEQVKDHFGPAVFRSSIPRRVRLAEAASYGEPIDVFDHMNRGAIAYRRLAEEVHSRLQSRKVIHQ
ncbi:MAG: AAA family ATPase [bacterium]|nr:AAA family ATPase [Acidimicrobiia bacterium]MCY4651201.1 AAA family ATPase [bacterium]